MTDLTERLRKGRLVKASEPMNIGEHGIAWSGEVRELCHPDALEAATTLETLTQEKEALRHKLWMVACHATGGGMPDIAGIDQSINDICVQISAARNHVWNEAKKHADNALTQENARLREALEEIAVSEVQLTSGEFARGWNYARARMRLIARRALEKSHD